MRVNITYTFRTERNATTMELGKYIEDCLEIRTGDGLFEQLQAKGDALSEVLARLIPLLVERKVLTLAEVADLLQTTDTLEPL